MTGVELAVIMPYIAAAGTAVSAIGAISAGNAEKRAADHNALVARQNAVSARQAAAENRDRQERNDRRARGAIRNNASNNLSLDVLEDQVMEDALGALTITHAGELEAMGLERSANIETARGKNARAKGFGDAAGQLLQGGSTLASSGALSSGPKQTSYATSGPNGAGLLI